MSLSQSDIDSAFHSAGSKPLYANVLYVASLFLTAIFTVVLFLAYPCLIAAIGYGGLFLAVNGFTWIIGTDWPIILQIGALVSLGALIFSLGGVMFAMVRPFFFRAPKKDVEIEIDTHTDPALVYFVNAVAASVRSKLPTKIILTGGAGASASTGGFWQTIFGTTRELRLGMCLFPALHVTSIGGVIAHECGHFGQAFGTRLTSLIRGVGSWFYNATRYFSYRDFMLRIREQEIDGENGSGIFIWIGIALNRYVSYVLWAFFKLSVFISSYGLRHMEFHADTYETEFAGSEDFSKAMTTLESLFFALGKAIDECQFLYEANRLPDDFASFVAIRLQELDENDRRVIRQRRATEESRWHSTHPATRDRIQAAEKRNRPGFFKLEVPGTGLFSDFKSRAQVLSCHFYEVECGIEVSEENLIPISDFDKKSKAAVDTLDGCKDYETLCAKVLAPFKISTTDFAWNPLPFPDLVRQFLKGTQAMDTVLSDIEIEWAHLKRLINHRYLIRIARGAIVKRIPIDPHAFGLSDNSAQAVSNADYEISDAIEASQRTIDALYSKKANHLFTALNLLSREELCPNDPAGRTLAYQELGALVVVFEHIVSSRNQIHGLHDYYETLAVALRLSDPDAPPTASPNLIPLSQQARADLASKFAEVYIPSDGTSEAQSVGKLLEASSAHSDSGRNEVESELFACGNLLAELGDIQRHIEKRSSFLLGAVDQLCFAFENNAPAHA